MKLLFIFLFIAQYTHAQSWHQLADFPGTERDDGVGVVVNSAAYFGTGLRAVGGTGADFYRLNSSGTSWTAIPSMPAGQQRQYACAFPGPNCFYVFGGDGVNGPANDLYKYSLTTNSWSSANPKPGNGVYGASLLAFGDKIIIIGGKAPTSNFAINEVWEYTISSDTWVQKNNFPFGGRFRASATVLNNTGYLLFGIDEQDQLRRELYSYDQTNDSWAKIMDFPQPLGRAYATLQPVDGRLFLFGGYDSSGHIYDDVWHYTPSAGTWGQLPNFTGGARKGGMSAVVARNFYYTCGVNATERLKETWTTNVYVGIKENAKQQAFSVYPNPASDIITLRADHALQLNTITLFDISGKELKSATTLDLTNNAAQLDLSGFEKGVYFLKVAGGNAEEWKKVVKE